MEELGEMAIIRRSWKPIVLGIAVCLVLFGGLETFRAAAPRSQNDVQSSASQDTCTASVLSSEVLRVPGGSIDISFAPGPLDLPKTSVIAWVRRAAIAASTYYGRFPVKHAQVRIVPVEGEDGVFHGRTFGQDGAYTRIPIGEHTTARELEGDWIMTHEFVHLAFPDMPKQHQWIEEGMATYVEPIARAQAGQLKPASIWRDMMRDMPKGEPQYGDQGLDNTHTWARTYWGGAIYCLRADLMIRQLTNNRKGLQDALRAIIRAGGNLTREDWSLERALKIGDRATGTKVLEQLYAEMKSEPVEINLASMWEQLGISLHDGKLSFDDQANWARARIAITQSASSQPETIASDRLTNNTNPSAQGIAISPVP